MANNLLFTNSALLAGEAAPFTGAWVPLSQSRETLYTAFGNGSGAVILEYKSPLFANDSIPFFTMDIAVSGYAAPAYSTSPMGEVRAVASGSGNFWCAATEQN